MLTYDYKCEICGKEFSVKFHFGEDKTNVKCPNCHSLKTHRVYSVPVVIFKGPGFYITEHGSKSQKQNEEHTLPEN